jgi:hypothetical protein
VKTIIVAAVICLGTLGLLSAAPAQDQLSSRIPAARHEKFKSILVAKDWSNPYLVVCVDGIEVISTAIPGGRKLVALANLRRALIDLPTSAWPYGRVVAIQENGVGAPGDHARIKESKPAVEAVLKALRLEIDWWPSA